MGTIGPQFNPAGNRPLPSGGAQPAGNVSDPAGASSVPGAGTGGAQGAPVNVGFSAMPLASLFALQQALTPQELTLLLRSLLQMPKELVQLMALLANLEKGPVQELLRQLVAENAAIPLAELQQMLTNQADRCQEKLLKLIQGSALAQGGDQGLKDLMQLLSQVTRQAKQSPAESLHATLSLYLPYYPLEGPRRFSLQFEAGEGDGEGGGAENPDLVVFIETVTLGNFRIGLRSGGVKRLHILAEHDPLPPEVLALLEKEIRDALAQEGSGSISLDFLPRAIPASRAITGSESSAGAFSEKSGATSSQPAARKPSVAIHPETGVSVAVIHGAYTLIRVILDFDARNDLNLKRAEAV